jgi:DNA transposition AAA+ family ATPase
VGLGLDLNWTIVETSTFETLIKLLQTCQAKSLSVGLSENAGIGKSAAYQHYQSNYKNVVLIECANYWTKRGYVRALLKEVGQGQEGTLEELVKRLVRHLKGMDRPLLIIDQADKLKDSQLDLFMDLYNHLNGSAGFVLSGVKTLEKRFANGVRRDKMGFREMYSRLGSKFYSQLGSLTKSDVMKVCEANGVACKAKAVEIFQICNGDLRVVRRQVEKYRIIHGM